MNKVIPISSTSLSIDNTTDQYVSLDDATALFEKLKSTLSDLEDEVIEEIRAQDKDDKKGGDRLSLCQLLQRIASCVSPAITKETSSTSTPSQSSMLIKDNTSPKENHGEVPIEDYSQSSLPPLEILKESFQDLVATSSVIKKDEGGKTGDEEVKQLVVNIRKSIIARGARVDEINNDIALAATDADGSPHPSIQNAPEIGESKEDKGVLASKRAIKQHGGRSTKVVSSVAILEAVKGLSEEGDDELLIRYLRPTMESVEINTRRNLASLVLGEKYGTMIVDLVVYRHATWGFAIYFLWVAGCVLGGLSLFGILPSYWSFVGSALSMPAVILNAYFLLIIQIVKMLLRRFDTW